MKMGMEWDGNGDRMGVGTAPCPPHPVSPQLSGFTSDPREVCSCLYDLETVVCKSFSIRAGSEPHGAGGSEHVGSPLGAIGVPLGAVGVPRVPTGPFQALCLQMAADPRPRCRPRSGHAGAVRLSSFPSFPKNHFLGIFSPPWGIPGHRV